MKNKVILITGSSKGIGEELALVFADNKYDIILHGRDRKNLSRIKADILKKGVSCYICAGDLRRPRVIKQLSKMAKEKIISVLINNAALHCPHLPLQKISDRQIEDILTTNLIAPIKLTKAVYSLFLRRPAGAIININSISGLENQELRTIYSASKWGLRGFTDTLRREARKRGIRVIGVYLSRVKTRPSFSRGMAAKDVAQKIFNVYAGTGKEEVIIDGRK